MICRVHEIILATNSISYNLIQLIYIIYEQKNCLQFVEINWPRNLNLYNLNFPLMD